MFTKRSMHQHIPSHVRLAKWSSSKVRSIHTARTKCHMSGGGSVLRFCVHRGPMRVWEALDFLLAPGAPQWPMRVWEVLDFMLALQWSLHKTPRHGEISRQFVLTSQAWRSMHEKEVERQKKEFDIGTTVRRPSEKEEMERCSEVLT